MTMKELEKNYNPSAIEEKLYQKWLDNKYFHADACLLYTSDAADE